MQLIRSLLTQSVFYQAVQVQSVTNRVVWGCCFPSYQGVQRVTNSVVLGCWCLVRGIWNNGPLAFAASMSVLFTLYKVHRGEWVLLSGVTSAHVTDICAGFVAWMRKTPGTNF